MSEKISSLHDDVEFPLGEKATPEFDPKTNFKDRYPDVGERGERSMINRFRQFGITDEDISAFGVSNIDKIDSDTYGRIITRAIETQYDTIFPSIFSYWSEMNTEKQWEVIETVAKLYRSWGIKFVKKGERTKERPTSVLSLEGADAITTISDVDRLDDLHIGSVALQYNDPNALAEASGLTTLGRQTAKQLLAKGIIIDLAHSNPETRRNVMDIAEEEGRGELIAYTHGSTVDDIKIDRTRSHIAEIRGLRDDEIKRIIKMKGIIGLGVSRPFFSSLEKLVERIDRIHQIENGPNLIGLGTDFGGVPPEFLDAVGIKTTEDLARIGDMLASNFGYDDETIRNIMSRNVRNWVS